MTIFASPIKNVSFIITCLAVRVNGRRQPTVPDSVWIPNGTIYPTYILHYFWGSTGQKVVHCVGIRLPFGTHDQLQSWQNVIFITCSNKLFINNLPGFLLHQSKIKFQYTGLVYFSHFYWQRSSIQGICKQCVCKQLTIFFLWWCWPYNWGINLSLNTNLNWNKYNTDKEDTTTIYLK